MTGIDHGVFGQRGELRKRGVHLWGRTLEQPTASERHQTICGEHRADRGDVKCDMSEGMAGDVENMGLATKHIESVAIVHTDIERGQAMRIRSGANDLGCRALGERVQPLNVIGVVVREQNGFQRPTLACKRRIDRRGFGDIHENSLARIGIGNQIGVVVLKACDDGNLMGHGNLSPACYGPLTDWPIIQGAAMHLDVQDLRNFYYRSALGRAAQRAVRNKLLDMWPEAQGLSVAGFGFAAPLLRPFLPDARRVVALMPGPQGVIPWPAGQPNVAVLCEEMLWPIETGHVDRLVVMHGLETSENPTAVLDECFRTLGPGGRAMFIVPNRAGLWSRSDRTPFGYGRPYTLGQLEAQLKKHGFLPERHATAMHQPPSARRAWMKSGAFLEKIGSSVPAILPGGVLLVEASKRVHAQTGPGERLRVPNPLDVLAPKPKPETAVSRR